MTPYTKRLIIVVGAQWRNQANGLAAQVDPKGGAASVFGFALSPTGQYPATHYWCDWVMLPGEETSLRGLLNTMTRQGRVQVFDGNTMTLKQVAAQLGLQPIYDE